MASFFVYGTLTDPATAEAVLPAYTFRGPATLRGLHRVDGDYPTLAPGGEVTGRLLATDHPTALDRYEGVDRGLYARVTVPLVGGDGTGSAGDAGEGAGDTGEAAGDTDAEVPATVETYVGDPARVGADVTWPGEAPFPACVREYVRNEVENERRNEPTVHVVSGETGGAGET